MSTWSNDLSNQGKLKFTKSIIDWVLCSVTYTFSRARILDSSSLTLERRVTIILPLMGRQEQFRRFLDNYEKEFLESKKSNKKATRLIVVLFAEKGKKIDSNNKFDNLVIKHFNSR